MARRKIIKIDVDKCTGCGDCIPNCPEAAKKAQRKIPVKRIIVGIQGDIKSEEWVSV